MIKRINNSVKDRFKKSVKSKNKSEEETSCNSIAAIKANI
jgi:hypothetical protein